MAEYIKRTDVMKICEGYSEHCFNSNDANGQDIADRILDDVVELPTADVVEVEKYNDLREDFIDFVCSGVNNPAPYCKNRCSECLDSRGMCTYRRCVGFNPDGEMRADNGN